MKPFVTASDTINNIGPPLRNTSAFVLQGPDSLALVPRGGIGEFCFGGDQVFRGYLNMPELDALKIIDHPKFGRLYRSGDYGRVLWDGSLEYHSRQDDQVKIRGQRVELGEINNVLLESPKVVHAITLLEPKKLTIQRILTFWVPNECYCTDFRVLNDHEVSRETIKDLYSNLVSSLPNYMIPALILPVSSIPMTLQGKVNRQQLLDISLSINQRNIEYFSGKAEYSLDDHQWSPHERTIRGILCSTISCKSENVGRHTSFFGLGLDSISAMSFSKSLRKAGFFQVDASIIMRHPTVSRLDKKLTEILRTNNNSIDARLPRSDRSFFNAVELEKIFGRFDEGNQRISKVLPCTPLQEAMLSSVSERTNLYYHHIVFEIHGNLNRLRDAWQTMVSKHDILRTVFVPTESKQFAFAQIILNIHQVDWTTTKVRYQDLDACLNQCIDQITRSANENDPLYSFKVFRTSSVNLMLFSMHHALYDGEAIQLLLEEVQETYAGHYTLPAVPYQPFLAHIYSVDQDESDSFWKKHLKGFEPVLFPCSSHDVSPAPEKAMRAVTESLPCSSGLQSLEESCRRLSLPLLRLVQASWARLLSLHLDTADVCFGNVVSGRTLALDGIERIVAPCFNTLPVRVDLTSNISNLDLAETLQAHSLDASPYQFTPLRRIRKMQNLEGRQLFDTLFIFQKPHKPVDHQVWSIKEEIGGMDVSVSR